MCRGGGESRKDQGLHLSLGHGGEGLGRKHEGNQRDRIARRGHGDAQDIVLFARRTLDVRNADDLTCRNDLIPAP